MALRFEFQEILNEISAFESLSRGYVAPTSQLALGQFRATLETYRGMRTLGGFVWEIPKARPFVTKVSDGYYEPKGKKGQHSIFAEITSIWEIKREAPAKKSAPAKYFQLDGIASTRVRLMCERDDPAPAEIAMWRMEIGDSESPGCYFHSQILGETDAFPFPHSLPVPRLPIFLFTPVSVAEFVLAELFQDSWSADARLRRAELNQWVVIQQKRIGRLLDWKKDRIAGAVGASPWCSLKAAQPHDDLFV